MRTRIAAILALVSASFAFGQLDSNSVTVTSSRTATPQPDQAIFGVFVSSNTSTSLNDVVAALQSSGITLANFSSVTTGQNILINPFPPPGPPTLMLQWAFALVVPLSNTKATVATLTGLQQNIPQKNSGLTLSFSLQGTQVSQQLQQSQPCVISDLIADARAQAQTLAASGGRTLSGILALSSATASNAGVANPVVSNGFVSASSFSLPPICTVTVKFALLGS